MIAMLILGIALGGILPAVWSAVRRNYEVSERIRARAMATEIREEIFALPREKPTSSPRIALPPETPRSQFISPLDFDGLDEHPPRDPLGSLLPGTEAFTRKVAVRFVDPENPEREASAPTGLVEITVEISQAGEKLHTLRFLRSLQ